MIIIHLSDIHFTNCSEGAGLMIKPFFKDVAKQLSELSVEEDTILIVISGDIVYEGENSDSFEHFRIVFQENLSLYLSKYRYQILIVPGNHDIDRKYINQINYSDEYQKDITKNCKNTQTTHQYFLTDNKTKIKFSNFSHFVSKVTENSDNTLIWGKGFEIDNIGFFCINSALISFGGLNEYNDYGHLVLPSKKMFEWCESSDTKLKILITHHPLSYLYEWNQSELLPILESNFKYSLTGHIHKPRDLEYNEKFKEFSSPPFYTTDELINGYSIVVINNNKIKRRIFREWEEDSFVLGKQLSRSGTGIDLLNSISYNTFVERQIKKLKNNVNNSLLYLNKPINTFIERKLSLSKDNVYKDSKEIQEHKTIEDIISINDNVLISAGEQFGLTCLAHEIIMRAYEVQVHYIHIDFDSLKRNSDIDTLIDNSALEFGVNSIDGILIDSYNSLNNKHKAFLNHIVKNLSTLKIFILGHNLNDVVNYPAVKNAELTFVHLHLLQLSKSDTRRLVKNYITCNNLNVDEDNLLNSILYNIDHMNLHRIPSNCLMLLHVFDGDFSKQYENKHQLISNILNLLFSNVENTSYESTRPTVEEIESIFGKFCYEIIKGEHKLFSKHELIEWMKNYLKINLIDVDIDFIIYVLIESHILTLFTDKLKFKNCYWVYYFASKYMRVCSSFKEEILSNKNYLNYPLILEFYVSKESSTSDTIKIITDDLTQLTKSVFEVVGISDIHGIFDKITWNAEKNSKNIKNLKKQVESHIDKSSLSLEMKDFIQDKNYNFGKAYNQNINKMVTEFKVISLYNNIEVASECFRNSNQVDVDQRKELFESIFKAWEQISILLVLLAKPLARNKFATFDGLNIKLDDSFDLIEDKVREELVNIDKIDVSSEEFKNQFNKKLFEKRLESIIISNPFNVIEAFIDNIRTIKQGPMFRFALENSTNHLINHFIAIILLKTRPEKWHNSINNYLNKLNKNSYYFEQFWQSFSETIKDNPLLLHDNNIKSIYMMIVAKVEDKRNMPINKSSEVYSNGNKLRADQILAYSKNNDFKRLFE